MSTDQVEMYEAADISCGRSAWAHSPQFKVFTNASREFSGTVYIYIETERLYIDPGYADYSNLGYPNIPSTDGGKGRVQTATGKFTPNFVAPRIVPGPPTLQMLDGRAGFDTYTEWACAKINFKHR